MRGSHSAETTRRFRQNDIPFVAETPYRTGGITPRYARTIHDHSQTSAGKGHFRKKSQRIFAPWTDFPYLRNAKTLK